MMGFFKRLIDLATLRAERPLRRLLAYYVLLATVVIGSAVAFRWWIGCSEARHRR
jgi:hypothetical protein